MQNTALWQLGCLWSCQYPLKTFWCILSGVHLFFTFANTAATDITLYLIINVCTITYCGAWVRLEWQIVNNLNPLNSRYCERLPPKAAAWLYKYPRSLEELNGMHQCITFNPLWEVAHCRSRRNVWRLTRLGQSNDRVKINLRKLGRRKAYSLAEGFSLSPCASLRIFLMSNSIYSNLWAIQRKNLM